MNDVIAYRAPHLRFHLGTRIKRIFSGYKAQRFFHIVRKKTPKYILTTLLVWIVVYTLLHPIDKIKVRYFITRECTVDIVAVSAKKNDNAVYGILGTGHYGEIHIDGNWIEADGEYYNIVDGKVYRYRKDADGQWMPELYKDHIGASVNLFDKKNYVRDKSNPFVWRLKDEIIAEYPGLSDVRIKRVQGCIAIVRDSSLYGYDVEMAWCFRGFATTRIEFPWDE